MSALSLVHELRRVGAIIRLAEDGKLDIEGNEDVVDVALPRLLAYKPELMRVLAVEQAAGLPVVGIELVGPGKLRYVFELPRDDAEREAFRLMNMAAAPPRKITDT